MVIQIISLGNKPTNNMQILLDQYIKRLPSKVTVEWKYIKHVKADQKTSLIKESAEIIKNINPNSQKILLDEKGSTLTSPELSKKIFSNNKMRQLNKRIANYKKKTKE